MCYRSYCSFKQVIWLDKRHSVNADKGIFSVLFHFIYLSLQFTGVETLRTVLWEVKKPLSIQTVSQLSNVSVWVYADTHCTVCWKHQYLFNEQEIPAWPPCVLLLAAQSAWGSKSSELQDCQNRKWCVMLGVLIH